MARNNRSVSVGVFMDINSTDNANNITNYIEVQENVPALIEKYAVPVICFIGLLGNTMSFIVFVQKFLRTKSCSLFLAARSLSDNGFLITLLIMWSSSVFDLQLSRIAGVCQITVFLTYVFGCLSVWLVVFVTAENYIRICKPLQVNSFCQTTKAKYSVIVLLICALCCYNYPLWTMTNGCIPDEKHHSFLKVMVYIDSLLTLIVPTVIIVFLLTRIAISSISAMNRRRRLSAMSAKRFRDLTTKVTTMLLAVTLIFIMLNLPLHIVRFRLLVISIIKDQINISTQLDLIIQTISQLIYYVSLSTNFFVYYIFGSTFRKTFIGLFRERKKSVYAQTEYSTLSSSKGVMFKNACQLAPDSASAKKKLLNPKESENEITASTDV